MVEDKEYKIEYHLEGPFYLAGGKGAKDFIRKREERRKEAQKRLLESVLKNSKSF